MNNEEINDDVEKIDESRVLFSQIGGEEMEDKNIKGCDCCNGDEAIYWSDNENNAFINSKGEMVVMAKDKLIRFKVKYCPNCGRKFETLKF